MVKPESAEGKSKQEDVGLSTNSGVKKVKKKRTDPSLSASQSALPDDPATASYASDCRCECASSIFDNSIDEIKTVLDGVKDCYPTVCLQFLPGRHRHEGRGDSSPGARDLPVHTSGKKVFAWDSRVDMLFIQLVLILCDVAKVLDHSSSIERPIRILSDMLGSVIPYFTPDITRNRIRRQVAGIEVTKLFQRASGTLKFTIVEEWRKKAEDVLRQKTGVEVSVKPSLVERIEKEVDKASIDEESGKGGQKVDMIVVDKNGLVQGPVFELAAIVATEELLYQRRMKSSIARSKQGGDMPVTGISMALGIRSSSDDGSTDGSKKGWQTEQPTSPNKEVKKEEEAKEDKSESRKDDHAEDSDKKVIDTDGDAADRIAHPANARHPPSESVMRAPVLAQARARAPWWSPALSPSPRDVKKAALAKPTRSRKRASTKHEQEAASSDGGHTSEANGDLPRYSPGAFGAEGNGQAAYQGHGYVLQHPLYNSPSPYDGMQEPYRSLLPPHAQSKKGGDGADMEAYFSGSAGGVHPSAYPSPYVNWNLPAHLGGPGMLPQFVHPSQLPFQLAPQQWYSYPEQRGDGVKMGMNGETQEGPSSLPPFMSVQGGAMMSPQRSAGQGRNGNGYPPDVIGVPGQIGYQHAPPFPSDADEYVRSLMAVSNMLPSRSIPPQYLFAHSVASGGAERRTDGEATSHQRA